MSTEAVEQTPPAEEAAPPVVEAVAEQPPPDDDAALDQVIAEQTIDLPEGEKLVPLSAVTTLRSKLKATKDELGQAKEGSARAQSLEQQLAQLQSQLQQIGPKAQAYDAAVLAQQQQPRQEPKAEDDPKAVALAQRLDLYKPDGTLDAGKARDILGMMADVAQQTAQQAVAPYAQHTTQTQAQTMQARAKQTLKDLAIDVPDAFVDSVWNRMSPEQTASPDAAKWLLAAVVGAHQLTQAHANRGKATTRNAAGQFVAQTPTEQPPPPLYTEKAGGKDPASTLPLDDKERKFLKDTGMSEADYLKSTPPWMRR